MHNMENENRIDLGEIIVPDSWDKITLKMYSDIERYYADKNESFDVRKVLHIFTGKSEDEINAIPLEFLEKIMSHLSFLQEPIKEEDSRNWVDIDGIRYTVHTENKLKTGEYVAADSIIKNDPHNYAALMAILCRKDGELFDSKFENEVLESRIKLFEEQPVTKILPICTFFLRLYVISIAPSLLSLKVQEAISQERENIWNLRKSGALSILSTRSVMRKLRKLEKSISSI